MDIIKLLPEYLDTGVDAEELAQIAQAALAQRIRELKLAIGQAVVQARSCTLLDNPDGEIGALHRARQLQREYHHFFAEWSRLQVPPHPELASPPQADRRVAPPHNGAGPEALLPGGKDQQPGA